TGLRGPTQFVVRDDDTVIIAQLNGEEGGGTGQVVAVAPDDDGVADAEPAVLFESLDKPTGVEVLGDQIWVMEKRRLSSGPIDGGELTTVLDELPFNGRSEGTLTATDDGRLLYDTSGTLDGVNPADGAGILWALTPGGEPEELARGFKHAYARTFDAAGTLWQTEMSDGSYDGESAPDEVVAVAPGDDFGWPRCIGDRVPVDFYDGTAETCAGTPRSHALFAPGATPTSIAVAPWDPDMLLVALWNEGRIVSVPRAGGDDGPVEVTDFLTGLAHPQHLVADGDRLLVGDFDGGRILAVTATG
ncbi:MAG: glucose sorbosone dehydrogenase, partial [Acidimicrobiia bacterium]|nr:glucose sorbosone dehydrogenase [Acidimicrobiia bacterium]